MENLKQKLLSLGIFEDNQYLDFYCDLIEANKNTVKEKSVTQSHHIIPKCIVADNTKQNLVNLKYSDHILAHYYLCLCCNVGLIKYKLEYAFVHLTSKKWNLSNFDPKALEEYSVIYNEWYVHNKSKRLSEETKRKISEANLGKHLSEEAKRKLSIIHKQYRATPETREKLRISHLGHKLSSESSRKLSETNKGRKPSPYTLECSRKARMKPVLQYDLNGNFVREWPSNADACRAGYGFREISAVCCGRAKTHHGFIWKFKN